MTDLAEIRLQVAQTNLQLYRQLGEKSWDAQDWARVKGAYELAASRFARLLRPNGKSFLAHLVGTASITAAHGGDSTAVAVALLHAWRSHALHHWRWRLPGTRGRFPRQLSPSLCNGIRAYELMHGKLRECMPLHSELMAYSALEQSAALIHVANEYEELLDAAVAVVDKKHRDASSIDGLAQLADALGKPALAAQLRSLLTETAETGQLYAPRRAWRRSYAPDHESPRKVLRRWPEIRR